MTRCTLRIWQTLCETVISSTVLLACVTASLVAVPGDTFVMSSSGITKNTRRSVYGWPLGALEVSRIEETEVIGSRAAAVRSSNHVRKASVAIDLLTCAGAYGATLYTVRRMWHLMTWQKFRITLLDCLTGTTWVCVLCAVSVAMKQQAVVLPPLYGNDASAYSVWRTFGLCVGIGAVAYVMARGAVQFIVVSRSALLRANIRNKKEGAGQL